MSESVLVVGSGGREHAFGAAVAGDGRELYFTPGNAGTKAIGTNISGAHNPLEVARDLGKPLGLTIIGPEAPLMGGLADRFRHEGLPVCGPDRAAAELEGSKVFAHQFMTEYGIPQPRSQTVWDTAELAEYERHMPEASEIVIKADGLAGGKGVVLPETNEQACKVMHDMLTGQLFGGAGMDGVLVQERLHGPEFSLFVATDGERFVTLPASQDHKRLQDGDRGPNTGGMGAYAPVPSSILNPNQAAKAERIAEKTIVGMQREGSPYRGILYIGCMLAEEYDGDPVVIEYNARFGDPEAEVVLPLLRESGVDVYDLLRSTDGHLNEEALRGYSPLGHSALTVCLAAPGYPDHPQKGAAIYGLERAYPGVDIYHGGTKRQDGQTVASGGRVLYVTGHGQTVDDAAARAYAAIGQDGVHFDGMHYRTDIGWQARRR